MLDIKALEKKVLEIWSWYACYEFAKDIEWADKKALEKLKERQNLAYKKYRDKKEAAMLDEIAVLRYSR